MNQIKLGIIREGKVPHDFRTPLSPKQCKLIQSKFPHVSVFVQESPIRKFTDQEYRNEGIEVVSSVADCDIILGVKEVNVADLIPGKKMMFFSHTIKKQPYNRLLLQKILENKIELIDYEVIKDKSNKRLVGFGRFAGIVGCYNGIRTFGLKHGLYELKKAVDCSGKAEIEQELKKVVFPANTKFVLTGFGRVGYGAREILDLLPIMEIGPEEYLNKKFDQAVFTHLDIEDYFEHRDGKEFKRDEFYKHGKEQFKSGFSKFLNHSDMYIACHYWSDRSPAIITQDDLLKSNRRLKVVADVSCDIADPIASTIKASTIEDPIYGYNPVTGLEMDFLDEEAMAVMAVDNLPCELPADASEDFGNELIKNVLPALFIEDFDQIIERALLTNSNGQLTERYSYLEEYVGK